MTDKPFHEQISDKMDTLITANGDRLAYHKLTGCTPTILFFGGFMSDMYGVKSMALYQYCLRNNYGYVCFDYSGCGQSTGDFMQSTIGLWHNDSLAIIDNVITGPIILVGSSMGGWLSVLAALARPHRVAAMVTIAAACDFTQRLMWSKYDENKRKTLQSNGVIEVGGMIITHKLITEGDGHLVLGKKPLPIHCPLRLLHGDCDDSVPVALSQDLMQAVASPDAALTIIKGGDHRLSSPKQLEYLYAVLDELRLNHQQV